MAQRQLSPREIADAVATRAPRHVAAVYLFGSQARGTARPDSDVDLGLLYVEPPAGTLLAQPFLLEAELSAAFGRPVQCVVMNAAPPDLVHRILRDQQLLLDRDPSLRVRFEVAARNRYFDLKPFLDRYRKRTRVA
jgi:predicted nucleotidyltransferase